MAVMYGDKDLEAKDDKTFDEKNECFNCNKPLFVGSFYCGDCWWELMEVGAFDGDGIYRYVKLMRLTD